MVGLMPNGQAGYQDFGDNWDCTDKMDVLDGFETRSQMDMNCG